MIRPGSAARREGGGGFTLIELLVVIAIISVLLSLLLPNLAGIRRTAWTLKCQINLKQIGLGIQGYLDEQREGQAQFIDLHAMEPASLFWQVGAVGQLQPYLGGDSDPKFDLMSSGGRLQLLDYSNKNPVRVQEAFNCPSARGLSSVLGANNLTYLLQGSRVYALPIPDVLTGAKPIRYTEYFFNDSGDGKISPDLGYGVSGRKIRLIKHPDAVVWTTDALDEFPRHTAKVMTYQAKDKDSFKTTGTNNFLFMDHAVRSLSFRDYNVPEAKDPYGGPGPFYNWGHFYPNP